MVRFSAIFWDPSPALFPWEIPFLERPILWYGFLFALGFVLGYFVFHLLLKEFLSSYRIRKETISKAAERISFFVCLGAIFGARLGDVFFYQGISSYKGNVLNIFKFWEGGLSSHGAILGILLSLWFFSVRYKKQFPMLNFPALLDLLSIPSLLAGGFIRIGNFFNQEILGTPTSLPWGVLFGHPLDGGPALPRHPAQLYEAIFYFTFFALLWYLRKKYQKIYRLGNTSGLFFMGTFLFRFFIEFIKSPQGVFLPLGSLLNMGQILSIPLILLGAVLFFCDQSRLSTRAVKGD